MTEHDTSQNRAADDAADQVAEASPDPAGTAAERAAAHAAGGHPASGHPGEGGDIPVRDPGPAADDGVPPEDELREVGRPGDGAHYPPRAGDGVENPPSG